MRIWPACLTYRANATSPNFLLRSGISALVRTSLDFLPVLRTDAGRLCGVSAWGGGRGQALNRLTPQAASRLQGMTPTPALDLRSLATNFVRNVGWRQALIWLLVATGSFGAAANHQVLVIVGAAGQPRFASGFQDAAKSWTEACGKAGAEIVVVGLEEADRGTEKDRVFQWIDNLDTAAAMPAWIVYVGHGTYNGRDAHLNLRGPDISASELAGRLPQMDRTLVFIHGGSASGPFLPAVSAPNRIVISATRSGEEINYARFGEMFAQMAGSSSGDMDRDGQTSLLEAFLSAHHAVDKFYKEAGRLASEHPLIDDNGDRLGTPPDWFRGTRVIKTFKANQDPDGFRAHQIALIPSEQERILSPEQRQQRDRLEAELEALRKQKSDTPEELYYDRLESIFLELGKIYFPEDCPSSPVIHPEDS